MARVSPAVTARPSNGDQHVGPADQQVIARAAQQYRSGQRAGGIIDTDPIIAVAGVDLDRSGVGSGGDAAADRHLAVVDHDQVVALADIFREVVQADLFSRRRGLNHLEVGDRDLLPRVP